ncbi:hypothetical protein KAS33_01865, partial [bacterium]|nr:hypothetical protein [bacterium]
SIYLLLKCDGFRSLKYSILLGLSLGLGMLVKQSYPIFIVVPFICIVWKSNLMAFTDRAKTGNPDSIAKVLLNLIYCLLVASALTLPWHISNFRHTLHILSYHNSAEFIAKHGLHYTWDIKKFLTYYPIIMTKYCISVFFAFLFLCSSIFFFRTPKFGDIKRVFIWLIVFPLIFFTFSLGKNIRFLVPLLPAVAIITAQGIYQIKNRLIRWIGIGLIVVVGLFRFSVDSFNTPILPNISFKPFARCKILLFAVRQWYRPMKEEWMVEDVLFAIKRDMEKEKKDISTVMLLSDHKAYNANTLNYYSSKERLGIQFLSAAWIDNVASVMEQKNYHYIIYKDANNYATIPLHRKRVYEALVYLNEHLEEYRVIYKRSLLDGSNVIIYK